MGLGHYQDDVGVNTLKYSCDYSIPMPLGG